MSAAYRRVRHARAALSRDAWPQDGFPVGASASCCRLPRCLLHSRAPATCRADDATTTLKVYFGKQGARRARRRLQPGRPPWPGRCRGRKGSRGRHCRSCFAARRRKSARRATARGFPTARARFSKDVRIAGRTAVCRPPRPSPTHSGRHVKLWQCGVLCPGGGDARGSSRPSIACVLAIEGQPRLFYDWMEMECD